MMFDLKGGGGSKLTPTNQTLGGKKWTLGGGWRGSKIVEIHWTLFMYVPLQKMFMCKVFRNIC